MQLKYIENGNSLAFDRQACVRCGRCIEVCPHAVFAIVDQKVVPVARKNCMECGACARNCPANAIQVSVGVGCAQAVLRGMMTGKAPACGCDSNGKSCC